MSSSMRSRSDVIERSTEAIVTGRSSGDERSSMIDPRLSSTQHLNLSVDPARSVTPAERVRTLDT